MSLALVFLLVMTMVRGQAVHRRFSDLEMDVNQFSHDWRGEWSMREEQEDHPDVEWAVYERSGHLVSATSMTPQPMVIGDVSSGQWLSVGIAHRRFVFVGSSLWGETEVGLKQLSLVLTLLWLPLACLTAGVAWYGGGLVLRPVKELVLSAEHLSGAPSGGDLTTTDTAEFAELAATLNRLIDRVHLSASLQEQFASDAAHELRNPLAMLRTRVEANLMRPRSTEEHVLSQTQMLVQIDRLSAIVETLLTTARQTSLEVTTLDLADAVTRAVSEWLELSGWAPERIALETEACSVTISPDELGIIVRNLLDNAAHHSPMDARIEIRVENTGADACLSVRDFGKGISSEDKTRVFERFYRSDEARSRLHGGAGIGLSVVRRIVESRGGTAKFADVDRGAKIQICFPRRTE